jgi:hypothetical protein
VNDVTSELTREQCECLLGWNAYAKFSVEQLRAAVRNRVALGQLDAASVEQIAANSQQVAA